MGRTTRRFGLQSRIFATDPWAVVRNSIDRRSPAGAKEQAQAFRAQAEDHFRAAAVAELFTTRPVLLYYSFHNLAKAYVLTMGQRQDYEIAYHGLSDRLPPNGKELTDSILDAFPSGPRVNVFDDFLRGLTGNGLAGTASLKVSAILPQLLQGHRLWCAAAREDERFIEIARLDVLQHSGAKQLWIVLNFFEDDLTRLDITHGQLLAGAALDADYREVRSEEIVGGRRLLKFEKMTPIAYHHRPSDQVQALILTLKRRLWANVLSVPPYRKYYIYVSPATERQFVLPQLASVYCFFYYLGSVTRYRPQKVSSLVSGELGAQLQEGVANLPNQFVYLMASEFARQDISRAAIV